MTDLDIQKHDGATALVLIRHEFVGVFILFFRHLLEVFVVT